MRRHAIWCQGHKGTRHIYLRGANFLIGQLQVIVKLPWLFCNWFSFTFMCSIPSRSTPFHFLVSSSWPLIFMTMLFCSISLVSLGSCGRITCQFLRRSLSFAFGSTTALSHVHWNSCTFRVLSVSSWRSKGWQALSYLFSANEDSLTSSLLLGIVCLRVNMEWTRSSPRSWVAVSCPCVSPLPWKAELLTDLSCLGTKQKGAKWW